MSISITSMSSYPTQSMGAAQGGPPPRGGAGGPGGTRPSHEEAIQTLGAGNAGVVDAATIAEERRYMDFTLPSLRP